jgi:predicted membrane protein
VCARGSNRTPACGPSTSPLDAAVRSAIVIAILILYVVVFAGSCIGTLVLNITLRHRLRTHHADVWTQLGSPTSLDIALQRDSGNLWFWVWRRRYDELSDAATVRMASLLRICGTAFFGCVGIAIAVMVVSRLFHVGGI